jgi:hypothetical protein
MSNIVPAVRILPMDSKDEPDFAGLTPERVQQGYFLGKLLRPERPPGKYCYRKLGLKARSGTVVLFQFANKIIASATLDRVERFPVPDGPYEGALYFSPASIKVFDPVGLEVVRAIWPKVTGFGRAKWSLDPKGYPAFEQRLTGIETAKV